MSTFTTDLLAQANLLNDQINSLSDEIAKLQEDKIILQGFPSTRFTLNIKFNREELHQPVMQTIIEADVNNAPVLISLIDTMLTYLTTQRNTKQLEFANLCGS